VDEARRSEPAPAKAGVLGDKQIVAAVYQALAKRHPQSRTRGRPGTPAEVVLRLLVLKHMRNWSYGVLEREFGGFYASSCESRVKLMLPNRVRAKSDATTFRMCDGVRSRAP
jgi:hypothetical protein